jgi:Sporulation and spore germination
MIPRHLKVTGLLLVAALLGAGLYLARLQHSDRPVASQLEKPVTPPVAGPPERVTLYVADDAATSVRSTYVSIPLPSEPSERAKEILRALLARYTDPDSPHPLAAGADVNSVFLVNGVLGVVDLNAAAANEHRSGVLVEELTVVSIVQTLAANVPGLNRVKLLVDGKERETLAGHADLIDFYDVGSVSRLVMQMQPGIPQ